MFSEFAPGMLIVLFGLWGAGLYVALAARPRRHDKLLSTLIALVSLAAAGAWGYALATNRLLPPVVGRSILALALAALIWLGLARGGRHDAQ